MDKKAVAKNYRFLGIMLGAMILGCIVGWPLVKIWDYFGGKNHATVIHAIDWTKKRLKKDKDLTHDYSVFLERINK